MNIVLDGDTFKNDYRDIIRKTVKKIKKDVESDITFKKLAESTRIQPAYLSKVVALKAHLNEDQLWRICNSLNLGKYESQFIQALSSYQKTEVQDRKEFLKKQVEDLSHILKEVSSVFSQAKEDRVPDGFHLDIQLQLVFQYCLIKNSVEDVSMLAQDLGMTPKKAEEELEKLREQKLLLKVDGQYLPNQSMQTHLSSKSSLFPTFFRNRLLFALDHMNFVSQEDAVHFSVMFTSDKSFQKKLKDKLFEVIRWAESEVAQYDDEDIYMLNIHSNQLSNIQ